MSEHPKVDIRTFTMGQIRDVERALGIPVTKWSDAPSVGDLYVKVYAVGAGIGEEEAEAIGYTELMKLVTISGGDADPTTAGSTA